MRLQDLNQLRKGPHFKAPREEDFLLQLNQTLQAAEAETYQDYAPEHPFIFIFGLPRSGTTLISQLIAHCFDVGYINNLMARFWLAPLTGVKLSQALLKERATDFASNYAATGHLADIHEFGYFWRYWLKKERVADIINAQEQEPHIDWAGLERTLLNIQHEFGRAMVFKNIFGAYHVEKFVHLMPQTLLFVYIQRDPLDVALSILDAREKFYGDLNTWWSTYPPEYHAIKDLPYVEQIGAQVHYLRRFYARQIQAVRGKNVVTISYQEMCASPGDALQKIRQACEQFCAYTLELVNQPPAQFEYRQHTERVDVRDKFKIVLEKLARQL